MGNISFLIYENRKYGKHVFFFLSGTFEICIYILQINHIVFSSSKGRLRQCFGFLLLKIKIKY